MQETWVWFLCQEDPQEKEVATHSSILAWNIPWTEKPGRLQSVGSQRVGHSWAHTHTHTHTCVCTHAHMHTRAHTHTHTHTPTCFPRNHVQSSTVCCMFLIYWKVESDLRMWLIAECGLQLGSPGSWCCLSKSASSWTYSDLGVMRSFLLAVMKT